MASPERSSTFLTNEQLEEKVVIVVGCGSIGGQAALTLARMGVDNYHLIDNGKVEPENVGPQPYIADDVGGDKTAMLREILNNWQPNAIVAIYQSDAQVAKIDRIGKSKDLMKNCFVILAVDSMKARKEVMERLAGMGEFGVIVDTRMGLQELWMAVNAGAEEQQAYGPALPTDEETVGDPCTAKTISYTPMIAAGWIGRVFAAWCRGEELPKEIHCNIREWNSWTVWRKQGGATRVQLGSTPEIKEGGVCTK